MGRLNDLHSFDFTKYGLKSQFFLETIAGSASLSGANPIAAVAGAKVKLVAFTISTDFASGSNNLSIRSTASATELINFALWQKGPIILPFNEYGWAYSVLGEGMTITNSGGSGSIVLGGSWHWVYI